MVLLAATIIFVPIATVVLSTTVFAWVLAPASWSDVLAPHRRSNTLDVTALLWFAAVLTSMSIYYSEATAIDYNIRLVDTRFSALVDKINVDCKGCLHLSINKLLTTNIHQLIVYADEGLSYLLPTVLGITSVLLVIIAAILVASVYQTSRGHALRLITFVFLSTLAATGLTGAIALTDAFAYLRDDLESSQDITVRLATKHIPCHGFKWPNTTAYDTNCITDPPEPVAGCYYPDTMLALHLQPIGLPDDTRFPFNISEPLAYHDNPSVECTAVCAFGLERRICQLQDAVDNLLTGTLSDYIQATNAFVYTVFLTTIVLIVVVELADPKRNRLSK